MSKMIQLTILWLLFFITHSGFATTSVKAFFQDKLKEKYKYYRLFYNGLSLVIIFWIFIALLHLDTPTVLADNALITSFGFDLMLFGFAVLVLTFEHIHLLSFLGLSQNEESEGLITEGVYQYVRHPLYSGLFLILVGWFLSMPTQSVLLSVGMSILYIVIGIEFEEKKLRRIFGEEYVKFAFGKKKFIPFVY
jgi:methanethiol S-methyltransferase